jgi:glycosyltransferase involved in cell wall biosynthesis
MRALPTTRASGRRVLYVQYTNPAGYPPIVHSACLLADQGFDVRVLGTDALAAHMKFPRHPRVEVRLMPFQSGGWRQKLHYLRFALWVLASAVAWRPTWVYASDPLSCPVAVLMKRLLGLRVIYHEHDSPSSEPVERGKGGRFMRLIMSMRRALARSADLCVLPSAERARVFAASTGRSDVLVAWNCPRRAEVVSTSRTQSTRSLRVLYHGSIVPARVPMSVLEAVALTPAAVSLSIIGYETVGHAKYVGELRDLAARLGIADRVRIAGPMSRHELMTQCATCDVGLSLLPIESDDLNERSMVGASNKPFDYLACGLPVLVSELPDWVETYVDAGLGRSCDPRSASSIAASLQWFLDHPAERIAMGERGRDKILRDWNYEVTFAPVVARLQSSGAVWPEGVPTVDPIR